MLFTHSSGRYYLHTVVDGLGHVYSDCFRSRLFSFDETKRFFLFFNFRLLQSCSRCACRGLLLLFITTVPNTKLCAWGEEDILSRVGPRFFVFLAIFCFSQFPTTALPALASLDAVITKRDPTTALPALASQDALITKRAPTTALPAMASVDAMLAVVERRPNGLGVQGARLPPPHTPNVIGLLSPCAAVILLKAAIGALAHRIAVKALHLARDIALLVAVHLTNTKNCCSRPACSTSSARSQQRLQCPAA